MTKHTPLIRLQAAQRDLALAREACPHWDMESEGLDWACCYRIDEARRELRLARKQVEARP